MKHATAKAIETAAEWAGVQIDAVEQGRKHIKVKVSRGNRRGLVICSLSPSDHRWLKAVATDMKRVTA